MPRRRPLSRISRHTLRRTPCRGGRLRRWHRCQAPRAEAAARPCLCTGEPFVLASATSRSTMRRLWQNLPSETMPACGEELGDRERCHHRSADERTLSILGDGSVQVTAVPKPPVRQYPAGRTSVARLHTLGAWLRLDVAAPLAPKPRTSRLEPRCTLMMQLAKWQLRACLRVPKSYGARARTAFL
jgi:hypothetical protein